MFIGSEPRGVGLRCVRELVKLSKRDCAARKSPSNKFVAC